MKKGFTPLEKSGYKQSKLSQNKFLTGFTLIELLVTIAIIGILSSIILFAVTRYIDSGKDSNLQGNLAVLIPAGEIYYNGQGGNSYSGFCESNVVESAKNQVKGTTIYCGEDEANNWQSWAACAQGFSDPSKAFCADSRGVQKPIENSDCQNGIVVCE